VDRWDIGTVLFGVVSFEVQNGLGDEVSFGQQVKIITQVWNPIWQFVSSNEGWDAQSFKMLKFFVS